MSRITYIPPEPQEPELQHPQPPRVRPPVFRKSEAKARLRKAGDEVVSKERAETLKRKEDRANGFFFIQGFLIGIAFGVAATSILWSM